MFPNGCRSFVHPFIYYSLQILYEIKCKWISLELAPVVPSFVRSFIHSSFHFISINAKCTMDKMIFWHRTSWIAAARRFDWCHFYQRLLQNANHLNFSKNTLEQSDKEKCKNVQHKKLISCKWKIQTGGERKKKH